MASVQSIGWLILMLSANEEAGQDPANPFGYRHESRPHVLVDQTHDYLFVVYHLAYFLHERGMLGVHSDRTITWELIRNCDVMVTHQGHNDVPYTAAEIETLKRFVKRGGGLLLIGNNAAYSRKVTVLYNDATKAEARRIMQAVFPRVREELAEIYGRGPAESKAERVIHFFCNAGGGYSWNQPFVAEPMVGLPGLSNEREIPAWKFGVVQHELTHSWRLPLALSGHLLMSFNSIDLNEKLPEMRAWREQEWSGQRSRLRAADPELKLIDLAVAVDYRESPGDRLRSSKWNWTFRKLREKYGADYFTRLISLAERDGVGIEEDIPALIRYLSLAAGENLYPWFAEHGTAVQEKRLPPGLPIARIDVDRE